MKILLDKVVKVEDIEINFSISQLGTIRNDTIIQAFVVFPTGGVINHKEPFIKSRNKSKLINEFNKRESIYVKQILEAKKDYDNRRTQRN